MKLTKWNDAGFTSGWRFQWGWLTGGLDPFRGSLAPANHVGKAAAVMLMALALAGCPQADILSGKPSPYKAAHEQRVALVTPVVASVADVSETPEIEHIEAVMLTPEPQCTDNVFRVYRCNGGEMFDWWSGEPI